MSSMTDIFNSSLINLDEQPKLLKHIKALILRFLVPPPLKNFYSRTFSNNYCKWDLIKGGGGSLVREKIVNAAAKQLLIVADQSKMVDQLGQSALPVEVLPFGWEITAKNISQLGCKVTLRKKDNDIFVSDNGNYIVDCYFDPIQNPKELHSTLKQMIGVVETGLFIDMADRLIIGCEQDTKIVEADK